MSFAEVVFLLGPVGAVVIAPAAIVVLGVRPRRRWAVRLGVALTFVVAAGFVGYWILWRVAYDYEEAFQPTPAALEIGLDVTMTAAAVGSLGLVAIALTALVLPRQVRKATLGEPSNP
ncbi:hypothetical protein A8924_3942 [Saccharopolyspora erythraea NRRL 2338]|uniref:Uncharacterized protein n=1 Tax=Saccharopolyspora erythraea TaxID=1836 RepID=A0ABN1CDG5_SACER|nr:hypothetical protein [Saccharopolyspora erythraea]EQD82224.1 hypothetical protein N599_31855 [Saccharopolyspora erythraea D]PFG96544.1 hypothetical protein A8924_3942 [Saccharopolyspora erythraea NRRL 2338]QRK93033.1 hypothetical protein JQX30_18125 [Saccharopolyspora erythraea]